MYLWSKLSNIKWEDAWQERFAGYAGLVISQIRQRPTIRVELYCATKAEADQVQEQWGGSVRKVQEQNWMALALPRIEPVKIRDSLLIVSETEEADLLQYQQQYPQRKVISIPVEMAFGTGDHATTATVLRMLTDEAQRRKKDTWTMLDVGCGTGLLAIAAALLGANQVEGFDFDLHAVRVALENAKRNKVEVQFSEQDLLSWQPCKRYDVIAANVFADVLDQGMPALEKALSPRGTLFLSGILKEHLPQVEKALTRCHLQVDRHVSRGRWQTLRVVRASESS